MKPIVKSEDRSKLAVIWGLYAISVLISLSGIYFGIYSLMNGFTFKVLNTSIPGEIMSLLVAYLGIRYFLSVRKLSKDVYKPSAVFSWQNFKKARKKGPNKA